MSIVTKTGDAGQTGLMYNRRVSKADARIEACGEVDELNAALGLARATAGQPNLKVRIETIQKELIGLMGELATLPADSEKYAKGAFATVTKQMVARLEDWVKEVETKKIPITGWVMPGANVHSAALDFARTVCRRAERRICALRDEGQVPNADIVVYLNRLSDLLWLWARENEAE
jgi:cob(I)alamin adenosyltransferase